MSEKITALDAVEGQKYTSGSRSVITAGELVERRPGGGQLRRIVNEHGVHTDVALDYPLWAIEARIEGLADLIGMDEAKLRPALAELTDAQLDALVDRDGRTWLLEYRAGQLRDGEEPPSIALAGECSVCGKIQKLRPKHGTEDVLVLVAHNSAPGKYCLGGGEPSVAVGTVWRGGQAIAEVEIGDDDTAADVAAKLAAASDGALVADGATVIQQAPGAPTIIDQFLDANPHIHVTTGGSGPVPLIHDGDYADRHAHVAASAASAPPEPETPRNPWADATTGAERIAVVKGYWTADQVDAAIDLAEAEDVTLQADVMREVLRHKAALAKVQQILDNGPKTDKGKISRLRGRMEQQTTQKRPGVMVACRIALEGLGEHVPCDGNHPVPPCRDHKGCWHGEPAQLEDLVDVSAAMRDVGVIPSGGLHVSAEMEQALRRIEPGPTTSILDQFLDLPWPQQVAQSTPEEALDLIIAQDDPDLLVEAWAAADAVGGDTDTLVDIEDRWEVLTGLDWTKDPAPVAPPARAEAPTLSDAEADLVDRFVEEQTKVDESIYSSYRSPPTIIDGMTREQLIAQIDNEPKPSALGKWLAQLPLVMADAEAAGIRIRIDPLPKR